MVKLIALSAFDGLAAPGRYGKQDGPAGLTVQVRDGHGVASVAARRGKDALLREAVLNLYGADLPDNSHAASGPDGRFIGTGPGQWLAVSADPAKEALAEDLATSLAGLASITDQSSARAVLRLSGANVRDCLAKGLAIDLDPRVFTSGSAVTSTIGHMGVVVWRDGDAFEIALFRSMAASFWRWLEASAAEFGWEVVTTS